jgi:hypothetical protein
LYELRAVGASGDSTLIARPAEHDVCRVRPAPALAVHVGESKTSPMAEPVVASEYVDPVRAVTAELRELIPPIAWNRWPLRA